MNGEKKCSLCDIIKPISEFSLNGDGKTRSYCKKCGARIARERRHRNLKEYNRERREYNAALPESKKEQKRAWHRRYYYEHREELIKRKMEQHHKKLATDPIYARKKELQSLVNRILHREQTPSPATKSIIEKILGCDIGTLREYFFHTWEEEYGRPWGGEKFEIDHISPLNDAHTVREVERLFNYKNLRCITPFDNKCKYINAAKSKKGLISHKAKMEPSGESSGEPSHEISHESSPEASPRRIDSSSP